MERMIPPSTSELFGGTITDELDQIEVKVGKIGLNSSEQSLSLLSKLDSAFHKIEALDQGGTQKVLNTQLESILAKLNKEAALFVRDLGGTNVLIKAREKISPPKEQTWWYLDEFLAKKRLALLRRIVFTGGAILLVLLILGILYQAFLAPDPAVAARYGHEQSARDEIMSGNLPNALTEVDEGLKIVPDDPSLLVLKGVILDGLGRQVEAQETFTIAGKDIQEEEFYLLRGQAYIMANQPEKALADTQEAIKFNPDSIQGYLFLGQVHEMTGEYKMALDDYEKAYSIADSLKQYELAALARTRMAMLMQVMNSQIMPPDWAQTPSPTP